MNTKEKEDLHILFDKYKDNLELCLNYEDLEYISKTKKDFTINEKKAIQKYRDTIINQSFKNNFL